MNKQSAIKPEIDRVELNDRITAIFDRLESAPAVQLNADKTEVMWCASAVAASSLPHFDRRCIRRTSQCCPWLGRLHRQRPWRRQEPHYGNCSFAICFDTSPTTASVFLWCRWCILGYRSRQLHKLSEFLPIFSDASRPYLTLQLVRFGLPFAATTTWPTPPSRYSTGPHGCVFRNGLTSNWHTPDTHNSWHIKYCTVLLLLLLLLLLSEKTNLSCPISKLQGQVPKSVKQYNIQWTGELND